MDTRKLMDLSIREMLLRLRQVFDVPMGYEDETGFHPGQELSTAILSFEI